VTVPIYEYACGCGERFEVLTRIGTPAPACPACGGQPTRRPSAAALSGRVNPGPGPEQAPRTWEQTRGGDRETILHWQRTLERRAKLGERYPELAAPKTPVLAHEGPYARAPLHAHARPHPPSQDQDRKERKDTT
jgi:putative FmdB family regulatory protein